MQAAEWPLQGYWPFFEGKGQRFADISGRANNGTLGRLPGADPRDPEWIRGQLGVGSALRLDGNDFGAISDTASLRPARVTVEAWVRAPRSPGQFKYVFAKGGHRCEASSFGLYTSINGGMAFYVYDGKKWWRSPMVGTAIWDNVWHHVAGTYDDKAVRLYVDGSRIGTGSPFTGAIEYDLPSKLAYIGAYRGGQPHFRRRRGRGTGVERRAVGRRDLGSHQRLPRPRAGRPQPAGGRERLVHRRMSRRAVRTMIWVCQRVASRRLSVRSGGCDTCAESSDM